jgi:hypothetical protein
MRKGEKQRKSLNSYDRPLSKTWKRRLQRSSEKAPEPITAAHPIVFQGQHPANDLMKIIGLLVALILLANLFACVSVGGQPSSEGTSGAIQLLRSNKVQRLEIIYYPEKIQTRVRLTPEMLEKQHRYKLIVNDADSSAVGREIVAAIEAENFTPSKQQADFRWGCSFYNNRDERIVSLYFDASGKAAVVDPAPMTSNGHTVKCLQKVCAGFRQ